VIIEVPSYYGNLQWQKSADLMYWKDIAEEKKDSLCFIADTLVYYRAAIETGNCGIICSDTIKIKPNTFMLLDVSAQSDWDELLLNYDGRFLLVNDSASLPKDIFYKPKLDHTGYIFYCDSNGFPEKMIIDSVIIMFSNYNDSTIDIAIIDKQDSIYIFRNIPHAIPMDLIRSFSNGGKKSGTMDKEEILQMASWIAEGLSCAVGIASAPTGIGILLVGISCASFIYDADKIFFDKEETPVEDLTFVGVGFVTTAYDCLIKRDAIQCTLGTISLVTDLASKSEEFTSQEQKVIDVALSKLNYGTISDIEGNIYRTVQIGNQTWMAENLKTTKYNDGTSIPPVTDNAAWASLTTPAYCWYNNDEATYKATYGALYNWYTINIGNLCPTGWHVPSDEDWKQLEIFLGLSQLEADKVGNCGTNEGGKLKEIGTLHWYSPNTGATNETGFTGLPGGYCDGYFGEGFEAMGFDGSWWSSTEYLTNHAWSLSLDYYRSDILRLYSNKPYGLSVRCLKD
jgi:uncharacterized protein (TIGR02145 family)